MTVRALPAAIQLERLWPALRNLLSLASLVILPVAWWLMTSEAAVDPGLRGGGDAYGYWLAWNGGLYDIPWLGAHAFVYTPPVGLALWPFSLLPWPVFYGLFAAASIAAVVWMVGLPWAGLVLLVFYPVTHDIAIGNVHVFVAFAIAAGHRHAAWWSIPLLTKVTPGVSLAYYVAARQWRHALYAAGIAAVVALVSLVGLPLWIEWTALARDGIGGTANPWTFIQWPLTVRLPLALGIALVAGWRRWVWLLPLSVAFAMPAMWIGVFAFALAIPKLTASPRSPRTSER